MTREMTGLLVVLTSCLVVLCLGDSQEVLLTSDSPSVLDAPITFYGSLAGVGKTDPDTTYKWRWVDSTGTGHYKEIETNGTVTTMNYTIVYPSRDVRLTTTD